MGNEEETNGPGKSETAQDDPTKTVPLSKFAKYKGPISEQQPKRPVPELVKQTIVEERVRAEKDAPKTPEGWYLLARKKLDEGSRFLNKATRWIRTGVSAADIQNALQGANSRWLATRNALIEAEGLENRANLAESERMAENLKQSITDAYRKLSERGQGR